jgi:hypothetical protein
MGLLTIVLASLALFSLTLISIVAIKSEKKKKEDRSEKLNDSVKIFGENIDEEMSSLEKDIEEFEL